MKLLHFADCHIGVENYGKIDPQTGLNSRLMDFVDSLNQIIAQAVEENVDIALFAGDAYRTRNPNPTQQRAFAYCIKKLLENNVPLVMLVGNHDHPNTFGKANAIEIFGALAIDNIYIIAKPTTLTLATKSGEVQIVGIPYLAKNTLLTKDDYKDKTIEEVNQILSEKCENIIKDHAAKLDPSLPAVFLGHVNISGAKLGSEQRIMLSQEPTLPISAVAREEFDYCALGHIHKHQDLRPKSQPRVVYCGSVDRIDFGEEKEEKGAVLVDLQKGATSYRFIKSLARKFVTLDVDADADDPTETILCGIHEGKINEAIVRLVYRIPKAKESLVDERKIRDALSSAFHVAGIQKEIKDDRVRSRHPELTEQSDPMDALEKYIATRENLNDMKDDLKRYARILFEEANVPFKEKEESPSNGDKKAPTQTQIDGEKAGEGKLEVAVPEDVMKQADLFEMAAKTEAERAINTSDAVEQEVDMDLEEGQETADEDDPFGVV